METAITITSIICLTLLLGILIGLLFKSYKETQILKNQKEMEEMRFKNRLELEKLQQTYQYKLEELNAKTKIEIEKIKNNK